MTSAQLDQVRRIALALPGVSERETHGALGFYVAGRPLCYLHDNHRGDGRVSVWFPSSEAAQEELVTAEPDRFFRPTPSAAGTFSTWLAVFVDLTEPATDWSEIAQILHEAYRDVAPRRFVAELDTDATMGVIPGRTPLVHGHGVLPIADFCRETGLDQAVVEELMRSGRIAGGLWRDEAQTSAHGLLDDALPSVADLAVMGLSVSSGYDPDRLRSLP